MAAIATTGVHGLTTIPNSETECQQVLDRLTQRLAAGTTRIAELAAERAGSETLREQVVAMLQRWFTHGLPNHEIEPANHQS